MHQSRILINLSAGIGHAGNTNYEQSSKSETVIASPKFGSEMANLNPNNATSVIRIRRFDQENPADIQAGDSAEGSFTAP